MRYSDLKKISKLYFGYEELAKTLGLRPASARVAASRYVKAGFLVRLKRNKYVLRERWNNLSQEETFILANVCQAPSYISLLTAMAYYEITTQMQQDFVESIAIKRTNRIEVENRIFNYNTINKSLYFDFSRRQGFFIASPEKCLLDAMYLQSLGKYQFDFTSLDMNKVDKDRLFKLARQFPGKTLEGTRREYIEQT